MFISKKTTTHIIISLGLVISLLAPTLLLSSVSYAQSGQALEIGPPVVNLRADPGQKLETKISLRDVSSTALVVRAQVNDFTADGEDGTPKIILDEGEESPYSLRSWIATIAPIKLQPKQVESLPITINVPKNAAPGGYFGVVRFTGAPPELDSTGVSLSASLGALIFVQVSGDAQEAMSIEEFYIAAGNNKGPVFEGTPLTFVARIKNEGNTHEQPSGGAIIKDVFGKQVAYVPINQPPRNVLPSTVRKFESELGESTLGNKKLFGLYTAELSVTYGEDKQTITKTIQFWVIPWKLILIGIATLIILFFGLRASIRRYNSYVIAQARKRK